jgi:translation initiation factor IF-2
MASPASLASLGSARSSPSTIFEVGNSNGAVPRYRLVSRVSFSTLSARWSYARGGVCNCMVGTGVVEDRGIKVSSNSDLRETSNGSTSTSSNTASSNRSGSSNGDFILKPAPKPALLRPSAPAPMRPPQRVPQKMQMDRQKLAESLDEALEKVEQLDMKSEVKPVTREVRNNFKNNVISGAGTGQRSVNSPVKNPAGFKSVWRKGESVAPVQQKVVKEVPKVEINREAQIEQKSEKEKDKEAMLMDSPKFGSVPASTSSAKPPPMLSPPRPQVTPQLHLKPSIAPPTPPMPPLQVQKPDFPKERKGPILIDRFAAKKPVAEAVDPEENNEFSPRPAKGPQKLRRGRTEQSRRKSDEKGRGSRRQFMDNSEVDADIDEVEHPTMDVSIPGMPARRGVRRRRRMISRETRQQDEDEEPVKAEIIEVGEEGMPVEELAESLAVSRIEILELLYTRGIPPEAARVLDKDMVKLVCEEYEVEVLDAGSRLLEMAKKKEVLDEDDLDSLESRPPVITIMGHVDHGKVSHGVIS